MSRRVHVIGPYNTGTNLIHNIIKKCKCIDLLNDSRLIIGDIHEPFDKHTINIDMIKEYVNDPNNLLVIMYKNPYNWLYSMKKKSYSAKYTKLYLPVELYKKTFPNMIELYNFYYTSYLELLKTYSNVIFLNYARIINNKNSYEYTNNVFKKINIIIPFKNEYLLELNKPAKSHGDSVKNSEEAMNKYKPCQMIVKNFVNRHPKLKKSIINDFIEFYENI